MQTDPDLSEAIRRFERQYAENPDSLVFARLADLYRKSGSPESALEVLDEGLERHPEYLSAHIVRARCLRGLDREEEAQVAFHRVLELDSENLVALRSLAEMAWERGDRETAQAHLDELLELDPRNEEAHELLEEIRGGRPAASGREGPTFDDEHDPFGVPAWARKAAERESAAEPEEAGVEPEESRREPEEPGRAAAEAGLEGQPPEAGSDEPGGTAAGRRERAFDVEPAAEAGEAGAAAGPDEDEGEPAEPPGPPEPEPTPDADGGGAWWEVSGPEEPPAAEADPSRESAPEPAGPEAGRPEARPDEPPVGPASEAEELRAQIEELRMQAEEETDLSDAEEDLATETLANLYEAQGFYRQAVEMYEELAAQRPEDEDLRRRLERAREALDASGGAAGTPPAADEEAEPSAGPADEEAEPPTAFAAGAGTRGGREEPATAAGELRAVLRGEASRREPDAGGS